MTEHHNMEILIFILINLILTIARDYPPCSINQTEQTLGLVLDHGRN